MSFLAVIISLLKVLQSTILDSISDALSQIDVFLLVFANAHVDGNALRPDPLVRIYHIHPPKNPPSLETLFTLTGGGLLRLARLLSSASLYGMPCLFGAKKCSLLVPKLHITSIMRIYPLP